MLTMIETLTNYLGYDFVRNALIAGSLSAILGAIVGYFVIIRNVSVELVRRCLLPFRFSCSIIELFDFRIRRRWKRNR